MSITFKDILAKQPKESFDFYSVEYNEKGRILVIGDIHGCSATLQKLIAQINLQHKDYLFLLGDLVNKGPDSIGVIDIILDLVKNDYQVFPLKGNHEEMLLEDFESEGKLVFYPDGKPIIKEGNKYLFQQYVDFFYSLPYYYRIENYMMVHAGFNIKAQNPLADFESMLWQRNFDDAGQLTCTIIHGHDSTYLPLIESDITKNAQIINIDNGVYSSKWLKGNLLCLDAKKMKLYIEKSIG